MLSEVDDAVRLAHKVLLRRERTVELMDQVRSIIQASERAIQESRKLLAVNEAVLSALRPAQTSPVPLTEIQLDELAERIAKTRGGHAFVWNAYGPLPIFDSTQSTAIH
jgi:hypothetical protein